MAAAPPALVVEDIHKSFGKLEVLRGLGIEAKKGDVIAILGASGSGKSTFLRCINLLERPNRGKITVAGEELKLKPTRDGAMDAVDPRQLQRIRSRLGMVFQQFNLWAHMTVLQNVVEAPIQVLGLGKGEAHDRADALLRKVGLYDRRDYFPAHLSGGQQQRAAIARALAMEPAVLLFDEPTSALDPELVREVLEVMRTLAAEGRTMLVVTHEMGFAREVAGEVLFLHQGVIDCRGAPPAMFGAPPTERFGTFLAGNRNG